MLQIGGVGYELNADAILFFQSHLASLLLFPINSVSIRRKLTTLKYDHAPDPGPAAPPLLPVDPLLLLAPRKERPQDA